MQTCKVLGSVLVALVAGALALPATKDKEGFWKGTSMEAVFRELKDQALIKDSFQVSDTVSVVKNSAASSAEGEKPVQAEEGRGFLDSLESYVKNHDLQVKLPEALGQTLTVSARNIDDNEISLALRSDEESDAQVEGKSRKRRKNKLKKILVPILVFVLLKAMTLIPLAIGVLGLKAWNALQLSFFSFLISISLAMFQLFKKIASDAPPPAAIHAAPWQDYSQYAAARTLMVGQDEKDLDAQQLAYNAYTN